MFCKVEGLDVFEKNDQWDEAVELLYQIWKEDQTNAAALVRLLCECWYILMLWDCCMPINNLSFDSLEAMIVETVEYGHEHFEDNANFLCLLGYMLIISPFLFSSCPSLKEGVPVEEIGMKLLNLAVKREPDNPIYRILLSGFSSNCTEHVSMQRQYHAFIEEQLHDDTAVSNYFKHILTAIY